MADQSPRKRPAETEDVKVEEADPAAEPPLKKVRFSDMPACQEDRRRQAAALSYDVGVKHYSPLHPALTCLALPWCKHLEGTGSAGSKLLTDSAAHHIAKQPFCSHPLYGITVCDGSCHCTGHLPAPESPLCTPAESNLAHLPAAAHDCLEGQQRSACRRCRRQG